MKKINVKKVLIFGKGQLGQELFALLKNKYKVEIMDRRQLDITDREAVAKFIRRRAPQCVINAAAFTQVEKCEIETDKAFQVNAFGPYYLALAAKEIGALFIHISSDYVFDGKKKFFIETDRVNPLNVYGASKSTGETLVEISGANHYIIRTSAMFGRYSGENRINFVDRMISMAKNGSLITVVKDQFTSPTYAADLAGKIAEFIHKCPKFGIYHITNSGSCSWYEFTVKILKTMGLSAKVKPIKTTVSSSRILRPRNSILRNQLLKKRGLGVLPSWKNALSRYCKIKYKV